MSPIVPRRLFLRGAAGAAFTSGVFGQASTGAHHAGQYESLSRPGRIGLPDVAATQHVFDSPAPKATPGGRWLARAALPLSTARDHAGTVVIGNLIHVVGGRVDSFHTNSNLHHAYDARADRWEPRSPLPTARSGHGAVLYRDRRFVMGGGVQSAVHEAFTLS